MERERERERGDSRGAERAAQILGAFRKCPLERGVSARGPGKLSLTHSLTHSACSCLLTSLFEIPSLGFPVLGASSQSRRARKPAAVLGPSQAERICGIQPRFLFSSKSVVTPRVFRIRHQITSSPRSVSSHRVRRARILEEREREREGDSVFGFRRGGAGVTNTRATHPSS